MANGKPKFDTDFSQMGYSRPTTQTPTAGIAPVWQTLLQGLPSGSAGGASMKPPPPVGSITKEELAEWQKNSGMYNPDSGKAGLTQYANWYDASSQADPHSAEMQAKGAAPYSAGTPPALRQSSQGAGNLPAASAVSTGQPSSGDGGQGPLQYMLGKGKELWGKHKEGVQRFKDEYERRNIKSGYWEGDPEKTDTEKMSEDWTAGGSQNPDKIRASAVSKKDYMEKIKAQREWEASEEGQLYKDQVNQGMSAPYRQQMGSPGGFLNWGLNKMFGPEFKYETKSSDVYDIPPEFRGNN